jgi:hypothetical protein
MSAVSSSFLSTLPHALEEEPPSRSAWHPDPWETILQQQAQDQLCILAIRLLLAYALGPDLGRISNARLKLQLGQQSFNPVSVPAGFHSNPHLLARQTAVELLRCLFAMCQTFFVELFGVGIHRSNLLKLGVEIYSY